MKTQEIAIYMHYSDENDKEKAAVQDLIAKIQRVVNLPEFEDLRAAVEDRGNY